MFSGSWGGRRIPGAFDELAASAIASPKRNKKWFWKGCKPNSVCPEFLRRRESFVWAADTRNPSRFRETWSGPLRDSLFGLAPDGVFRAVPLTRAAVVSYTTFSPLPASLARRGRFNFLWHCPSEDLSTFRPRVSRPNGPGLRGIAPCGVRTFLPRLAPGAILRPSKTKGNLAAKSMADKAGFEGGAGCWLCGDSNRIKKKT